MKKTVILMVTLVILITAYAHEYILIASKFKLQKGDTLELHLFVAYGFNIEMERSFQKQITKKFELITQVSTTNLLAETRDATFPVLQRKIDFDGLGLIHLQRDYAKITLDNKKFIDYLKEDHIENISIAKSTATSQRERYTRYIKCLIQSGKPAADTLYKTITGHYFEITLLQNPYTLKQGSILKAQVLFAGKPLADKTITIRNRTGNLPSSSQISRTNANGICSFNINRKGDWFIHATHMVPCANPAEADWESFWASYSFGIE